MKEMYSMNEVQGAINDAYKILSAISVSGDAVDAIAACRTALRLAFNKAKDPETEKPEGGGGT